MSLGLRWSLLPLLIAGCASELLVVPDADWRTVPATQRDTVDRQLAADLAAARAELTAATTSLAATPHIQPTPVAPRPAPAAKPAAAGDDDHARITAVAQVESAKAAWQRADLAWRKLRVDAANARIEVVVCQRELVRAQTIDHDLPGTDHYDVAPLRGQFSQAQQRWYGVASNARQARAVLERASASLSAAKEAYAQLMRPPGSTQPSIAADDRPPPLQLTGGTVVRSDIHRRRGLRHFLDAGASPQLRSVAMQLNAGRSAQAIHLGMTPVPAAAPTNATPAVEAPRGAAPTAAPTAVAKPAERPAAPVSPAVNVANNAKPAGVAPQAAPNAVAKPADRPTPPASATAGNAGAAAKPADRSTAPTAVAKPADRPKAPTGAAASSATAVAKPVDHPAAPQGNAPPGNAPTAATKPAGPTPANPPTAATKPAGPAPASSSTTPVRPAGPAPANPPTSAAKPAGPAPANPPTTAAKPAERVLFPTSLAPHGDAPAPAKPAERPVSQADAPKR